MGDARAQVIALRPLPWLDARARWEWLRAGLEHVRRKVGGERWLPEDIYGELKAGTAFCYVVELGSTTPAFLIVQRQVDLDGIALFVWVMWAEPHVLTQHMAAVMAELNQLARSIGARRLRHESPRKGWGRFFIAQRTVYEQELTMEQPT
jgi:hypothetical protein